MKTLRSASLFLLTALAGTNALAQPYLFVDVSPYHRPADAPETLVSNFGDLGVFGYGAVLPKSLPRLVPVIEEATSEGVKLRKLDAAPVLDAAGVNACEGRCSALSPSTRAKSMQSGLAAQLRSFCKHPMTCRSRSGTSMSWPTSTPAIARSMKSAPDHRQGRPFHW